MYRYEDLEKLYQSLLSAEQKILSFSDYALYQLDGGFSEWVKAKKAMLENIAEQRKLLSFLIKNNKKFSKKQRDAMALWRLS